jgi:glycosyltransferase involved in cell wall biosynthesis
VSLPHILVISNYSGSLNPIRPEAEIFIGLIHKGFKVTVMTEKTGHYFQEFEKLGATMIDHQPQRKIDGKAIRLIKTYCKNEGVDIVHAFNSKAISNACIALFNSSIKIVGYRGYTGNIHWYDPTLYLTFLNPRLNYMICLADSVRSMFLQNGMSSKKAITIHKGHKVDWYSGIEKSKLMEFNIPDGALVCAFVANFRTKMKGLADLINSTQYISEDLNIRFLLIGEGMDTQEMKSLIANTSIPERFIFTGFRKDSISLVKSSDIAISASLFGEATQKAMIEAMYLGKPVIITDIPGNKGMVQDGLGGYVIPPSSPKLIAAAINKFFQNRDSIEMMGENAKTHISAFLSNEKTVMEYKNFYLSII